MAITAAEAQAFPAELVAQVNDDRVAIEIISVQGTAYLVSEDEYLSLRETIHLLRSPRNAERLREGPAEARSWEARSFGRGESGTTPSAGE